MLAYEALGGVHFLVGEFYVSVGFLIHWSAVCPSHADVYFDFESWHIANVLVVNDFWHKGRKIKTHLVAFYTYKIA